MYLLSFIPEVRARRVVHKDESEFLLNGTNGENVIKIPSANLNETGWYTYRVCLNFKTKTVGMIFFSFLGPT